MDGLFDVKITAVRRTEYSDLQEFYELPQQDPCCVAIGQEWLAKKGQRPEGLCESAWETLRPFVEALSRGEGHFYGNWMRNPYSALLSCNDGFRPVSFLIEKASPPDA